MFMETDGEGRQQEYCNCPLVRSQEPTIVNRDAVWRQIMEAQLAAATPSLQKSLLHAEVIAELTLKLTAKAVDHVLEGDSKRALDMPQDEKAACLQDSWCCV